MSKNAFLYGGRNNAYARAVWIFMRPPYKRLYVRPARSGNGRDAVAVLCVKIAMSMNDYMRIQSPKTTKSRIPF